MNYVKVASVCPKMNVCDIDFNLEEIKKVISNLESLDVSVSLFPELSITGYTSQDMFLNDALLNKTEEALLDLVDYSIGLNTIIIVGAALRNRGRLYNCACVIHDGDILGIVPKTFIPNRSEFYEMRYFASSSLNSFEDIIINGVSHPFGNIIFKTPNYNFSVEICEDLWAPKPPSIDLALNGADLIFNLSASNEIIGKSNYRKSLVNNQSSKTITGYVYSSSGVNESTTDLLFSSHLLISEYGTILNESKKFDLNSVYITAFIDIDRLRNERIRETSFRETISHGMINEIYVDQFDQKMDSFDRYIEPTPFIPNNDIDMDERCNEIINIQAHSLAKRMRSSGINKAVIGISGGLDSTLALLVVRRALIINNLPMENLFTVTMPGFGTTDRTYNNAVILCKELKTTFKEINIVKASLQHFLDLGHDKEIHDSTYENTQARERTQILMDLANKNGALVVGTGDLSEIALGWSTYNGDQMSMYNVNCSIPKTLVIYLVKYFAKIEENEKVKHALLDILDTPVSPELFPPDEKGQIKQKTEDIIGPYELHDFFLYHFIRYGAPYDKLMFLAKNAFSGKYSEEEINKWLTLFIKRFFNNQFKRTAVPDGPKVGSISLSPRGDLRMSTDSSYRSFLKNE